MIASRILILFYSLVFLVSTAASETASDKVIKLAASTSVENSGLLKYLLPKFNEKNHNKIELHIVGSGKALRLARTGDVDMVWVHSPASEKTFVSEGYGIKRHTVMRNNFILAGPLNDPGKITSSENIYDALKNIAAQKLTFVSRADDSGTNKKELALWKKSDIDPYGHNWYMETGNGMAASLKVAQQEKAYILIDRATFLVRKSNDLKIVLEDATNLANPYSIIGVNPNKHPDINQAGAKKLINWLLSLEGQDAIARYRHKGIQLFSAP